jgi:predicted PurR-regulated permease PerM
VKIPSRSENIWDMRAVLKLFFFCTLIVILEIGVYSARWAFLVSAIGVCFGVILIPVLDSMEVRFKTPRSLNAAIIVLSFISVFGFLGFLLFDLFSEQLASALRNMPQIVDRASVKISEILARYPWISSQFDQMNLTATLKELTQRISHGVWLGGSLVVGLIAASVIGLYTAMSPTYYFEGLLSFIPIRHREGTEKLLGEIAANLRRWFVSQLLAMTIVGVATTLVLWIIGVDYWFLFGLLAGLLDVVPYIGPTLPLTAVLLVNLAIAPWKIPLVVLAFISIHQFENNIVVPMIFRYRMKFPPVLLISTMLIMGSVFGVMGLLLTPGLFTVLHTVVEHYRNNLSR